jgi:2-polyprenyl-6-methoxyphenol hydroxylase-like FAD-dependent oxidoreductase
MKIAIIGGGPAGLYFARLMKRRDPAHEIVVVEQNPEGATYGFGIALDIQALKRLAATEPEIIGAIEAATVGQNRQDIILDDKSVRLDYSTSTCAIERLNLLSILEHGCRAVGVEVEHGVRLESLDRFAGWDLIVAADGAHSAIRGQYAAEFGTRLGRVANYLAWYGVGRPLVPNGLSFRRYRGGYFVGHYYAYTNTMSTFAAECDPVTWRESGLEAMSEPERRAYMERVFEPDLQGMGFIDNKSNFRNLPVNTNERWSYRNIVLLGDALHSAHPSIGSGTRLAMDDAQALFEAFGEKGADIPAALARYVEIRKPVRDRFNVAMERSYKWYERLRTVMQQPILDFTYDFLMRTGRIDDARLAVYAPDFYRAYQAYRAGESAGAAGQRVSARSR